MAIQPDTTTGTLTTTSGSVNFTTVGTQLLAREHLPGDRFLVNGLELQIATITGENAGTLTEPCPPEAAVSAFPVRLRWQPDGARVAAQTRNLIDLLGNGTLQSLAGIDGNADELLIFIGPNTLSTINRLDLVEGVDYNVQVNTLPERAAYDAEAAGFSVLVSDVGDGRAALFIKKSATSGDWSMPAYLTGPVGPMPTILAGTTSTLTPGTPATVSVTPGVNTYSINIGVPQGFQGVPGADGAQGPQGSGLDIGALGDLANRDNYDNEAEGFTYFDTENGDLYIREGATGNWAGPIPFQGPPGTSGALITVTDGVGNTTPGPYTLNAAPFDVNSVWVSVSGIEQYDYTISGNLITFGFPIAAGVPWRVKTSGPLPVGVPSDDSVGAAQINGADADAIRTKIGAGDVVGPSSSLNNTLPVFDGTTGKLIKDSGILIADVGTGDVVGPASSVNDRIAVFSGTTGKLIKDGGVTVRDLGGVPIGTPMPIISNLLPEGYLWLEGGTYDPLVYPEFAAYMNANSGLPAGTLPDFRNRVLRGLGTFTGLVGTLQEDAFQGHYHQAGYATPGFGSPGAGSAFLGFSGPGPSTTAAATVTSDGANGTPRISSETRVKSTIVRWAIKAYGSFINAGTADLVAIEQAISNGVIRKDLNQAAGSYSSAMKITVLSNTLQSWESIHRATFTNVAEYRRDELEVYRSIRLSGWIIPNSSGTNLFLQTWKVGGGSWQTSGIQKSALAVVAGVTSSGFGATDPGYLLGAPTADAAFGGISFQIQLFNTSSSTIRTRAIGTSEFFNSSGVHSIVYNGWQDPTVGGADMRLHLVAATGNISGEIVLEGLR